MIITRKHLPRRMFLKGAGTALALPLLDAMTPAFAARTASAAATPMRLAFIYAPTGMIMDAWTPAETGKGFTFPRILKPLEPFREDLTVFTGLVSHNGNALDDGAGDHARAGAAYLTGVHPRKTMGSDIQSGVSADQIAAQAIAAGPAEGRTRFGSLELGCEDARTVGNCDSGYSCAYTNSISWRTPTTPLPPETNPRMVFERLFGSLGTSLDPAARRELAEDRASILDAVNDRARELMGTLGNSDRRKVDEYLTGVRELEQRIQGAGQESKTAAPTLEKPAGIPSTFAEHAKLMYDLQVAAFQTGLTRVSTFMYTREGSPQAYPEIGITDGHHPLSHHRGNKDNIEKVTQINTFHAGLFAHFLQKLKSTQDGDGTLLDHTMVVYGSGLSDPNRHLHENLPVLLAGNGNRTFRTGKHIVYREPLPNTNLYLTLLLRMGLHPEKIGDSNGKLNELTEL
ncbi:MAG: DUF1552 domain-containing protein [Acidobacteriota bacterium]|nr:DUF1552 domain-containing protein [Acidobacteriota bacterium]